MRYFIYGAGVLGLKLADEVSQNGHSFGGFIDDDVEKVGQKVFDNLVIKPEQIISHVDTHDIIIICFPSLPRYKILEKAFAVFRLGCQNIRIVPDYFEILKIMLTLPGFDTDLFSTLISIENFRPNEKAIFTDQSIVITGAGGSIGSRLCFEAVLQNCKTLIINDVSESSLFEIEKSLLTFIDALGQKTELIVVLGDVSKDFVSTELLNMGVDLVIHAAAYKHVEMGQRSNRAVIENNVRATQTLVGSLNGHQVKNFILVSSDKAVNPTNFMGFSKLLCEEIVLNAQKLNKNIDFKIVRFGNVLGSSGSVIPIFRNAIRSNSPLYVRGENSSRFFMTIEEAAELICKVANLGKGGEKYVLDMGESVRILDLATCVAKLEGFDSTSNPYPIKVVELLAGEKEHEELCSGIVSNTSDRRILQVTDETTTSNYLRSVPAFTDLHECQWYLDLLNDVGLNHV